MQRLTEHKVWQRSHALALEIYRWTARFPAEERYGLVSQLRRAAVSVPSNIAGGWKRLGNAEYARFLNIAEASLTEGEYLLMLSRDLGYLPSNTAEALLEEIDALARMLSALRKKVEAKR